MKPAKKKVYLTTKERELAKENFGKVGCSFAKDSKGFYCYTHRARSESYPSVAKIPKRIVKIIESTG
jgi:hypothetical protein